MRKRLGKLGWWLPVINAVAVGLILWIASGWRLGDIWPDEAWIGAFVLVYGLIVLRLPIDDDEAAQMSPHAAEAVEEDEAAPTLTITALLHPPAARRPFLGHRYPAGTKQDPGRH